MSSAPDQKKVYLVLTRSSTNMARLIRLFTNRPYNHVSIGMDQKLDRLYSFGRRRLHNPLIGGFVREEIKTGFYHYFNDTECLIYELTVTDQQYARLEQFLTPFLADPMKYRFNFIGTVSCWFHIPFARKNCYFCSQFVSEALEKSGILPTKQDTRLVRPFDFFEVEEGVEIYHGKIVEYHPAEVEPPVLQTIA